MANDAVTMPEENIIELGKVYFSGPSENILTLWQYLLFYYFKLQIRLTLPNQSRTTFPNSAEGHQRQI